MQHVLAHAHLVLSTSSSPTFRAAHARCTLAAGLVAAVAALAGCGEPECTFPAAPSGASAITYTCPGASGDGSSAQSPTGTIAEALAAASDGGTILLARGSYAENVTITRSVSLVGSGDGGSAEAAAAEIRAPANRAVVVKGAAGVRLQGLRVASPVEIGIWLKDGAEVTVAGSRVEGSTGMGILATGGARLTLQRSVVSGSALMGVELAGGATAIVDDNNISGNAGGGLRVDDLQSPDDAAQIRNNTVTGNGDYGLAFFSSVAIVDDNNIGGTVFGMNWRADGVLVTSYDGKAPSNVTLRGNTVEGNLRTGVMFGAGAVGIVDDNNIAGNGGSTANDAGARGGGIWLQGGAGGTEGVTITRNTVDANHFAGIALLDGARAIVDDNNIGATPASKSTATTSMAETMGDGVSVAGSASADIKSNVIADCFRAGVFLSDANAADMGVTSNTISGNGYAMILQGGQTEALAADVGEPASGNTMSGNVHGDAIEEVAAGTYGALDTPIGVPEAAELPQ